VPYNFPTLSGAHLFFFGFDSVLSRSLLIVGTAGKPLLQAVPQVFLIIIVISILLTTCFFWALLIFASYNLIRKYLNNELIPLAAAAIVFFLIALLPLDIFTPHLPLAISDTELNAAAFSFFQACGVWSSAYECSTEAFDKDIIKTNLISSDGQALTLKQICQFFIGRATSDQVSVNATYCANACPSCPRPFPTDEG
jgi:hypothetical protein